ncbi:MAG: tryptophan 2,3-dioxygenase [Myxococcales bacterium FL481]|nr:MAG: tryptophan 2,3-dioxygenase [Myxococcales bacterium FL481]
MATKGPISYWDYIKTDELLALQRGLANRDAELEDDEVMFIVIHQIDELWLKLALRGLVTARDLFKQDYVPDTALAKAVRGLDRVTQVFRHATDHFALMESMTTRDYLGFRDKLYPASGFQSAQLREIEIVMGLRPEQRIPLGHETYLAALRRPDGQPSPALERVQARLDDPPSLREAVDDWLYRTPIEGSTPDQDGDERVVQRFVDRYLDAQRVESRSLARRAADAALTSADRERVSARYQREIETARAHLWAEDRPAEERFERMRIRAAILFIESYREHALLAWPRAVIDTLVALEQAMVVFRQRHARMVERVIGQRIGTGGSDGVAYLDRTALEYRVFVDLWATRTLLVRKEALPRLTEPEAYGFAYRSDDPD